VRCTLGPRALGEFIVGAGETATNVGAAVLVLFTQEREQAHAIFLSV
jgi:hypothetical protein